MMNFSRKFAMYAISVLLVAAPAAAADLIPYESGYLPEQYGSGPVSTYGPDAGYGPYGAVPNDCDLRSDEGSQGLCVPGQPYPAAVLPNGRYDSRPYQGSYRPLAPLTGSANRYNEYPDQRGYRHPDAYEQDRPPPYAGYPTQRGYGPVAPIVPGDPSRRAYGPGSQPSAALPSEPPYDRYSY
jgi:hypothetical protein